MRARVVEFISKVLGDLRERVVFPANEDVLGSRVLVSKGLDGIPCAVLVVSVAVVVDLQAESVGERLDGLVWAVAAAVRLVVLRKDLSVELRQGRCKGFV